MTLDSFVSKWAASGAAEHANAQLFVAELCAAIGVAAPDAATKDPSKDRYVFEYPVRFQRAGDESAAGRIDLYKREHFVFEAKQGGHAEGGAKGTARRDTPLWVLAMEKAYGQALGYVRALPETPPFVVVCDVGYCFDLYACFDRSGAYTPFPSSQSRRIYLKDLPQKPELVAHLRSVFDNPWSLDPSREQARVTREVAEKLAELAKALETTYPAERDEVARFLMRCLFTMFAEDVGLLPERLFTDAIERFWLPSPASFPTGVENLWRAMDRGEGWVLGGKLLRFNGGLFHGASGLKLDAAQLALLLEAARRDWSQVEPAIFGTLLERALDPKERHKLGAHFTPKAYVERLVRPTIEEPLREEWDKVRTEVRVLVEKGKPAETKKAIETLRTFHRRLCQTSVLDPACGTGNFLYVAFQSLKQLESEVLFALEQLGDKQIKLEVKGETVHPAQLHGIEVKPWAREIAALVLWIGYLQWHVRIHGRGKPPADPVLSDEETIECRDAVLDWDGAPHAPPLLDAAGKVVTRWDGETTKTHPVTGEQVPDDSARVSVLTYPNARKATWPKAEFIVGNPPFIGSKRMRTLLGDGYVDSLRRVYEEIPDGTDYVLYWWVNAAHLLRQKATHRFGLISTNSISQSMNRKATEPALFSSSTDGVVWAIPDHPWLDSSDGAAVRIAMTIGGPRERGAQLVRVLDEMTQEDGQVAVTLSVALVPEIHSDLSGGAAVVDAVALRSNERVCFVALVRFGEGFVVDPATAAQLESSVVHPLITGRDVNQAPTPKFVIDFFPLTEREALHRAPRAFQHLVDYVKPGRDQIRDTSSRVRWWRFGRDKPDLRAAINGTSRYIATSEVSKHRVFSFVTSDVRPDHSLIVVAHHDALTLGVLSSRIHTVWASAAGGRLGVGNDLRYQRARCFDTFPFPVDSATQKFRIREWGEQLDAHRKRQQAQHDDLTITGMYNVLAKLRSGEALSEKELRIHEEGLVAVLRQIHDELDAAVLDAYGWPHDLSEEQLLERLVALNAERAAEEARGQVRWLRPEYQAPHATATQGELAGTERDDAEAETTVVAAVGATKWPAKLAERVSAVYALTGEGLPLSLPGVIARFKNAKADDVRDILDSLAAVGRLTRVQPANTNDAVWHPVTAGSGGS